MLKRSIGMGINEQGLGPAARRAFARLLTAANLYAPADHVIVDVSANLLKIKDSVTPANDYYGQLFDPATFALNKFTFTRASSATRVNAAGLIETVGSNVPRIDYSRAYPALLMEGARTNLCLQSADISSASWTKVQATVSPDSTVGPDGSSVADSVADNAVLSTHFVQQTIGSVSAVGSFT